MEKKLGILGGALAVGLGALGFYFVTKRLQEIRYIRCPFGDWKGLPRYLPQHLWTEHRLKPITDMVGKIIGLANSQGQIVWRF
ncbi:hypothetical protein [Caldisericum sp.]|uniref:hypothetical protein n=1 Tax=Caldisericum sp. TaxID=2499687 RepID=UPI003D13AFB6